MPSTISDLIDNLHQSELFAQCPHCHDEFSLSESILFDGTQQFPREAEAVRLELQKSLDEKIAELQKSQISADEGAEKIAKALVINSTLTMLVLRNNNISDEGAAKIADALVLEI